MCSRYSSPADLEKLLARLGLLPARGLAPRRDLAPTMAAPVVTHERGRAAELMRWGLVPSWSRELPAAPPLVNARAETLLERPSFQTPFRRRRCLVPADAYYEWAGQPGSRRKAPRRVALESGEAFCMAGLWDEWRDPSGPVLRSFTIITTSAAPDIRQLHERMPVILAEADEERWLDPCASVAALQPLLAPCEGLLAVSPASLAAPLKTGEAELLLPLA